MSKVVRLVAALAFASGRLAAQDGGILGDPGPTRLATALRPPLLTRGEALAAVGAILAAAAFDGQVRTRAQAARTTMSNDLANAGNKIGTLHYMGPILAIGWAAGRLAGDRPMARAAVDATTAGIVAGGITAVLKLGFGRVRPRDGGDPDLFRPLTGNASFPSGHTTLAMAIATSLAHSTSDGWSDVAFYGGAALTGFARISHDKHWLSDVVAGSIVGYLVGRQITPRGGRVKTITSPELIGLSFEF